MRERNGGFKTCFYEQDKQIHSNINQLTHAERLDDRGKRGCSYPELLDDTRSYAENLDVTGKRG